MRLAKTISSFPRWEPNIWQPARSKTRFVLFATSDINTSLLFQLTKITITQTNSPLPIIPESTTTCMLIIQPSAFNVATFYAKPAQRTGLASTHPARHAATKFLYRLLFCLSRPSIGSDKRSRKWHIHGGNSRLSS